METKLSDFPGGVGVELHASMPGAWVQFLVGELTSHILHGTGENQNIKTQITLYQLYFTWYFISAKRNAVSSRIFILNACITTNL